jgi:hypothetical protein
MTLTETVTGIAPQPENGPKSPALYFEPALHPIGPTVANLKRIIYDQFSTGNPDSHLWNPELAERLAAYQPKILAIDGLVATNPLSREDQIRSSTDYLWVDLPGRPARINSRGQVLVLRGDLGDWSSVVPPASETLKSWQGRRETLTIVGLATELMLPAELAIIYDTLKFLSINDDALAGRRINRRDFLKIVGVTAAAGALTFGRLFFPEFTYAAPSAEAKDFWVWLAGLGRPRIFRRQLAHFRTALVAEKTLEAQADLGEMAQPGALVFGFVHAQEAIPILNDSAYRHALIQEGWEGFNRLLYRVAQRYPGSFSLIAAQEALKKRLAAVEILRVKDPGEPPYVPSLPERVAANVTLEHQFTSTQVWNLLS